MMKYSQFLFVCLILYLCIKTIQHKRYTHSASSHIIGVIETSFTNSFMSPLNSTWVNFHCSGKLDDVPIDDVDCSSALHPQSECVIYNSNKYDSVVCGEDEKYVVNETVQDSTPTPTPTPPTPRIPVKTTNTDKIVHWGPNSMDFYKFGDNMANTTMYYQNSFTQYHNIPGCTDQNFDINLWNPKKIHYTNNDYDESPIYITQISDNNDNQFYLTNDAVYPTAYIKVDRVHKDLEYRRLEWTQFPPQSNGVHYDEKFYIFSFYENPSQLHDTQGHVIMIMNSIRSSLGPDKYYQVYYNARCTYNDNDNALHNQMNHLQVYPRQVPNSSGIGVYGCVRRDTCDQILCRNYDYEPTDAEEYTCEQDAQRERLENAQYAADSADKNDAADEYIEQHDDFDDLVDELFSNSCTIKTEDTYYSEDWYNTFSTLKAKVCNCSGQYKAGPGGAIWRCEGTNVVNSIYAGIPYDCGCRNVGEVDGGFKGNHCKVTITRKGGNCEPVEFPPSCNDSCDDWSSMTSWHNLCNDDFNKLFCGECDECKSV